MPVPMKARKSMAAYKASRKVTPYIRANQTVRRYIPAAIGRGLNRRGQANKESGFVDLAATTYAMNTTGSITLVATIAQGASVNQRVGKKVNLKSIQVRGVCQSDTTTALANSAWMLVYDRRPTGALPAITDVLTAAHASAFTNDANTGRFKIIRRWQKAMIGNLGTAGQATDSSAETVDMYIDMKNLPCVFKAAGTGAIGDIEEGAVYLITVGDAAAGTADANAVLGFRTRFIDN